MYQSEKEPLSGKELLLAEQTRLEVTFQVLKRDQERDFFIMSNDRIMPVDEPFEIVRLQANIMKKMPKIEKRQKVPKI